MPSAFRDEEEANAENSSSISSSEGEEEEDSDEEEDSSYDSDDSSDDDDDDDDEFANDEDDERDEMKEVRKFAQTETYRVCVWKSILLVIILVVAEIVTAGTYRFLRLKEDDNFESAFELFATSVQDRVTSSFLTLRMGANAMANSISGAASAGNMSFPFVTLNDFEVRGQTLRESTGIETFSFSPYVLPDQKQDWVAYSQEHAEWWIRVGIETALSQSQKHSDMYRYILSNYNYSARPVSPCIFWVPEQGSFACVDQPFAPLTTHSPMWQHSPPLFTAQVINAEWVGLKVNRDATVAMKTLRQSVFTEVQDLGYFSNLAITKADHQAYHDQLIVDGRDDSMKDLDGNNYTDFEFPHSVLTVPVFRKVNDRSSDIVGQLTAFFAWDYYLGGLLPRGVRGLLIVLHNTCNQSFTYKLNGGQATFIGAGDFHHKRYDDYRRTTPFYDFNNLTLAQQLDGHCMFTLNIYPTEELENGYHSNMPLALAIVVGSTFAMMVMAFFTYDIFVTRRNDKVLQRAARATGIVSSMFPNQFREQLLDQRIPDKNAKDEGGNNSNTAAAVGRTDSSHNNTNLGNNILADFFPDTTIMFADIVGFTAWSSSREPGQVFELLETVYAAFDEIAKMRRVFKVETVGDCYVAVTGLPEPRKDHAVAMARFARDCVQRMKQILPQLEVKLGPDTVDLSMRVGLHSGAVTAGVLRGERSRFQLFGDTMNTASRMESTGKSDMIQVSHDTAELLKAAGKGNWLTPREEMIEAKGKGVMVTYWLSTSKGSAGGGSSLGSSVHSTSSVSTTNTTVLMDDLDCTGDAGLVFNTDGHEATVRDRALEVANKTRRLVDWNVEILSKLLKKIVAQRAFYAPSGSRMKKSAFKDDISCASQHSYDDAPGGAGHGTALDEVKEIIALPHYDDTKKEMALQKVDLDDEVLLQLREYIRAVAALYRDNAFHSFEHASHVVMATLKLLRRVVNPKIDGVTHSSEEDADFSKLHNYTYGITSDPLTQFACVFSAVIHDLDHPGVPNFQLKKENPEMALLYERSTAEQNSLDLAWNLFASPQYSALRSAVCATPAELKRFRQLVVNLVMATDVMDRDLNGFRHARWQKAFGESKTLQEDEKTATDRKATIVIEHLIQASDVSHTMQHWHIYRKWNGRLFQEMYEAYLNGRSESDPSLKWYEGEIGFFDFYVIPLAKKLAECGVFGVSSSEYLDYAMRNRREWEDCGKDVVAKLLEEAKAAHASKVALDALLHSAFLARNKSLVEPVTASITETSRGQYTISSTNTKKLK